MSHGGGSSTNAEPNLVPLLDLVLQLVMFFMMVTNFVMEQNDQSIKLPSAQQAKPITDTGPDVVHLSVDKNGDVKVVGRPTMTKDEEIITFLKLDVYQAKQREMAERKEAGEVKTLIVIRADENCDYEKIYRVMRHCQQAGLGRLQLRALQQTGK